MDRRTIEPFGARMHENVMHTEVAYFFQPEC